MIVTIAQANKSKSGKTLSIQAGGAWYTSKNWEMEQMVGQEIIFEPSSQTFPDGSSIQWLNDYVKSDAQTTPSGQTMEHAMAQGSARESTRQTAGLMQAKTAIKDRDASICAQALTKACTGHGDAV